MKNLTTKPVIFFLLCLSFTVGAQELDMSLFHGMKARNIGPAGMSGRVTSIDVQLSETDNILIGTAAGGVWQSVNNGHTWTPIFEKELAASIGSIKIFQKNPDIIYVGTGEGNPRNSQNSGWGMFKSIDGGKTWNHLGLENTRQIHRVLIHPDDSNIVYAGVAGATWGDSEERGVYKSSDGGQTWKKILYVNDRTGVSDLVMDPNNPNKIIAAMYEHRRWPWFYKSGGVGSAIYITMDGGENWTKMSEENGIPDKDFGRIGLAISPSKPDIIYAYIESEVNAIYKSIDGGENWIKVSKPNDVKIGNRPFYYADIYVDTQNPNRLYSIATTVTVSEDGGKTWETFAPGNKIHTDHHAWWSHPNDADHIIIGHDGGLNITHDRGENWWFPDNLPLAQFYHIRVDNAFPYNVMGGLQDNGSWRGPSQSWFKGGIRNMYWQRLSVGDGFDVVPDPLDNDYGYSMGQAGALVRWHAPTGQLKQIKPVHPDGEYLRFNWNTGIAIDLHDQKTIYYGSQYVHKSSDYGDSWKIISPDLTTNDPEKQKFLETGGLTYDVTGAEFHTTIITIDPSPITKDLIWVGTDDGQIQLTQDGGASWTNLTSNLKGIPENTWATQITASIHNPAEAFVVFDDHRRNNWEPYVYHTADYGKTWSRVVDESDVRGYTYCMVQDPIEENLLFVGTEFGLYVSLDKGQTWNEWDSDLPTMPISDLVIQPREHDLVIGTFGRAIWILDDIRPLRELASTGHENILSKDVHVFPVPDAYMMFIGESIGYRQGKIGDALFNGENRKYGALISYSLSDVQNEKPVKLEDKVKIEILDSNGEMIRTFYENPKRGINRTNWNLRRDSERYPQVEKPSETKQSPSGFYAPKGSYTVKINYNGKSHSRSFTVSQDPRKSVTSSEVLEKQNLIDAHKAMIKQSTELADELREIRERIKITREVLKTNNIEQSDSIFAIVDSTQNSIKDLLEKAIGKKVQGIYRNPKTLSNILSFSSRLLDHPHVPATDNQRTQLKLQESAINAFRSSVIEFKKNQLLSLTQALKNYDTSLIPGGN